MYLSAIIMLHLLSLIINIIDARPLINSFLTTYSCQLVICLGFHKDSEQYILNVAIALSGFAKKVVVNFIDFRKQVIITEITISRCKNIKDTQFININSKWQNKTEINTLAVSTMCVLCC